MDNVLSQVTRKPSSHHTITKLPARLPRKTTISDKPLPVNPEASTDVIIEITIIYTIISPNDMQIIF